MKRRNENIVFGTDFCLAGYKKQRVNYTHTEAPKYYQFGVNVFDIDKNLPPMEVANLAIKKLEEFFFETCKLDSNFKAINIDEQYFDIMAAKSCNNDVLHGFKPLKQEDIKKIYQMCLE